MRVRLADRLSSVAGHLAVAGLRGIAFRGVGDLRPGLRHPVLAVVFLDPVPGVGLDGLAAPHDRAVGPDLDDEVPAAADPGLAGQDRRLVLGDAADLRQLLVMRLERLGLAALAFRNAARMGRAGADIVRIAIDHRRRVGDGGVPRLSRLRRPVPRQRPGLGGPGLVAGCKGFGEPHAGGGDPAGGGAGIGHHGPVAGHRHRRARRRIARVAVGIDMGRGADLAALQGREPVGVVAGVGERQVAGRALMGGGRRGVLADRENRGREHGRLGQSIGECCGQERHRHRKIARHHRDVGPHRPYAGLGYQRDADIAARHRRRRRHALGRLAHRDAVQHRVERTPALQPDQPGDVGAEYRRPPAGVSISRTAIGKAPI